MEHCSRRRKGWRAYITEQHRVWTLWPYDCDATMKRTGMLYVRRSFCWEGWEGGDYDLEERLGYPRIGECNSITQYSITTLKREQDGTWHGVLVFGKAIGSSSHGLWQCAREGTHFLCVLPSCPLFPSIDAPKEVCGRRCSGHSYSECCQRG